MRAEREELKKIFWRVMDRTMSEVSRSFLDSLVNYNGDIAAFQKDTASYLDMHLGSIGKQFKKDLQSFTYDFTPQPAAPELMESMQVNITTLFNNLSSEVLQLFALQLTNLGLKDELEKVKSIINDTVKKIEKTVYTYFAARLLSLIRWFVFMHYSAIYRSQGDFDVTYVSLLKPHFHSDVCQARRRVFSRVRFSLVYDLFEQNAREYKGTKLVSDESWTFLNPHYGCSGIFLPVK